MLDVAAETEKQGEYGVHLGGSQKEYSIPDTLIQCGRLREIVEIHMLQKVDDYNAADGKAAQAVHNVYPGALKWSLHNSVELIDDCVPFSKVNIFP